MARGGASRIRQIWMALFILGAVLINYPFLMVFDRPVHLAGIPLLYLYFILGWGASIAVIALYARAVGDEPDEEGG